MLIIFHYFICYQTSKISYFTVSQSSVIVQLKMSDYPPKDTLVWDNMDQFCVNLTHNMKVYFKVNGSLLIKNFSNRNCIAVAGEVGNNQTRLFSLHRDGIKVVHNNNNCLGIQIIEEIINPFCNSM